jgi:hypothetical protein
MERSVRRKGNDLSGQEPRQAPEPQTAEERTRRAAAGGRRRTIVLVSAVFVLAFGSHAVLPRLGSWGFLLFAALVAASGAARAVGGRSTGLLAGAARFLRGLFLVAVAVVGLFAVLIPLDSFSAENLLILGCACGVAATLWAAQRLVAARAG